jgi:peptidoglycan-associated lipoprotein
LPSTNFEGTIIDDLRHGDQLGFNDIVFIDVKNGNWAKGDRFTILSQKRLIRHPVEKSGEVEKLPVSDRVSGESHLDFYTPLGKVLGNLIVTVGVLEIIEKGPTMSKAIIRKSYHVISSGDMLIPYKETQFPETRGESLREPTKEGYIVSFPDEKKSGGLGDLMFIDLGRDHNVVPGDRFEVYMVPHTTYPRKWNEMKAKTTPLMPHVIGEIQVVASENETSTVIATYSSEDMILGHSVRFKPRTEPIQLAKLNKLSTPPDYGKPADAEGTQQAQASGQAVADESNVADDPDALEEAPFPVGGFQNALDGQNSDNDGKLLNFRPTTALADIHFPFDRYDLDDASKEILKGNAEYLKQHPEIKVQIQGHTDERGTNNYNLALGARRTNTIKQFLVSLGIEENRMYVISYGEEKPHCMENSENCWHQNRRAHFMVSEDPEDRY